PFELPRESCPAPGLCIARVDLVLSVALRLHRLNRAQSSEDLRRAFEGPAIPLHPFAQSTPRADARVQPAACSSLARETVPLEWLPVPSRSACQTESCFVILPESN